MACLKCRGLHPQDSISTSYIVTLSDSFDLKHIYKDQNPEFFVGKGIKPGIARSLVENIRDWVENVKKTVPIIEEI